MTKNIAKKAKKRGFQVFKIISISWPKYMSEISSFKEYSELGKYFMLNFHMLQLSDYQKQFWNGWKNWRKGTSYATMSRLKLITWLSRSICVLPKEKCIIDDQIWRKWNRISISKVNNHLIEYRTNILLWRNDNITT